MPHPISINGSGGRERTRRDLGQVGHEGDVLVIDQRLGSDVTLDSLDPKEKYLKLESIEQTVDIQIGQKPNQVTRVGSLTGHDKVRRFGTIFA